MTHIRPATVKLKSYVDEPVLYVVVDPGDCDGEPILRSDQAYTRNQLQDEARETKRIYRIITGQRLFGEVIKLVEGGA